MIYSFTQLTSYRSTLPQSPFSSLTPMKPGCGEAQRPNDGKGDLRDNKLREAEVAVKTSDGNVFVILVIFFCFHICPATINGTKTTNASQAAVSEALCEDIGWNGPTSGMRFHHPLSPLAPNTWAGMAALRRRNASENPRSS